MMAKKRDVGERPCGFGAVANRGRGVFVCPPFEDVTKVAACRDHAGIERGCDVQRGEIPIVAVLDVGALVGQNDPTLRGTQRSEEAPGFREVVGPQTPG